jgi:hypothetical protein
MEKWQEDFENFMLNVGDREEVMFAVAIGKKRQSRSRCYYGIR